MAFLGDVFQLAYAEQPNYARLRSHFVKGGLLFSSATSSRLILKMQAALVPRAPWTLGP